MFEKIILYLQRKSKIVKHKDNTYSTIFKTSNYIYIYIISSCI